MMVEKDIWLWHQWLIGGRVHNTAQFGPLHRRLSPHKATTMLVALQNILQLNLEPENAYKALWPFLQTCFSPKKHGAAVPSHHTALGFGLPT
jgi:hypothetical protein